MKCLKVVALALLLHLSFTGEAQTYAINNGFTFNETVTTCTGTFYDAGITANYSPFESYVVTFCSGNPGKVIQMNFTQMEIGSGDTLFVYDGNNTNAHILDTFTNIFFNSEFVETASDTSSSGCLTFKFTSNASVQAAGWKATIKCGYQCKQKIMGDFATTPASDANGYTNICLAPDGTVVFDLTTLFPNNDASYHQSELTSKYHWFFGDGKDTLGTNVTHLVHTYKNEGGYLAKVTITDSNGCVNTLPINVKIRTSVKPRFNIQAPAGMCVGDTVRLTPRSAGNPVNGGSVVSQQGAFLQLPSSSDSLFLPDGTGVTYTSNLFIDQFAQGQTLTNVNQLKGIFLNLEHSFLGDIDIAVTAPNGVKVFLKNGHSITHDCYLGEPVDGDIVGSGDDPALNNIRGKGYDYWFNTTPQHGTMVQEWNLFTYTYVDNNRRTVTHKYLPSGSYTSDQSLSALVGTPLNGTWILQIRDWQPIDNGFLFGWHIELDPSVYPNVETYSVPIVSQHWITPTNGIASVNGTIATVVPTIAQVHNFVYRVVDGFGCKLDTTVTIDAVAAPIKPNLGPDMAFCNGQTSLVLAVTNIDINANYNWSNGQNSVTQITVASPDTYFVNAFNSFGCTAKDTIVVSVSNSVAVSLGADTFFCASKPNVLKPTVTNNVTNYLWNTGATTDTLKIAAPGIYWVKGSTVNGCNQTDSITVTDNSVNNYVMPIDTVICDRSSFYVTVSPPANTTILWNDGTAGNTHLITGPNTYSTVANHIGCLKTASYTVTTKPLPIVNLGKDTTICTSKDYLLKVSYPMALFSWNDLSTDTFLLAKFPGIYWVEGLLNQCTYRDSIEIKYKKCDCETIIANAFSPNGDGMNELFAPVMECVPINYQMSVFNRYGQPVFESRDYLKGWDGKKNGQPLPVGTYYYILSYFNNGLLVTERFTGSITLLR